MRRRNEVDTNKLQDHMGRVANMLSVRGSTIASVRQALLSEGMSEYDIYLTVKGAAMIWSHVQEALNEALPDTLRSPIHENVCPDCDALNEGKAGRCYDCSQ